MVVKAEDLAYYFLLDYTNLIQTKQLLNFHTEHGK